METTNTSQIHGEVAPGFERVKEVFAANFEHHGDVGAACSVHHRGTKVVYLWGGVCNEETGQPWAEDSIIVVASSTKGATAICANLLSHRVGLPVLDKPLAVEDFLAWEPPVSALATQTPKWEPGTTHGYHAITYGWLVGEDERAKEMLAAAKAPKSYLTQDQTTSPLDMSSRAFHAAELPAANGITDARSIARMYASLIGDGVDGVRLFNDDTVKQVSAERSGDVDEVMGIHSRFGTGFYLYMDGSNMIQDGVFGHGGAGGSIGFADPKADLGFGYVMNKMQMVGDDDPRTVNLAQALHDSIASQ